MSLGQIVARPPNAWLLRVHQGVHPDTGKRRYWNRTVHGDRAEAEAELALMLAKVPVRPSRASSLSEYLNWWLYSAVDCRLRPKTARDYRTLLDRYIRPALGATPLGRLRSLDVQLMLCDLSARGLAPRTVRYAHAVLRSALDQARRWKLLDENPAADLPLPRVAKPEIRVLTVKEARMFAAACLGEPHGLALVVALSAGLRPSEYLALRVCDFDPARGTVTITRTIERTRGRDRMDIHIRLLFAIADTINSTPAER